uniref:Uncharacterized protein n=1 Tax=Lutzomyia longipalpis TaxID=7200 RepID=A0A7G3B122_LUTLO
MKKSQLYRPPRPLPPVGPPCQAPPRPPGPPLPPLAPLPLPLAACARSIADFPLPAVPDFAPCFLNIGAFFSISGSMRKRILDPRM